VGRGFTDEAAVRSFLEPRLAALRVPEGLAGLDRATTRLRDAVVSGQKIGVFGDYDVDGVTTAALLTQALQQFGAEVVSRVARRDSGYGFGDDAASFFVNEGCAVIVVGDCGTSDISAIEVAAAEGVDVVVIDHHTVPEPDPDKPHPAFALVNPFRHDSTFPFRGMASVGLAFYAMAALRTRLRKEGWDNEVDLRGLLDLVAVGTVADLVPLVGENRILTAVGLQVLSQRRRPGFAALLQAAGVKDAAIDDKVVGWKLSPRLNAPGRLGDAQPALDVLLAETAAEAEAAAGAIEQANQRRRVEQERVHEEARAQVLAEEHGAAIVVAGKGWLSGVVGIVAARLVDEFHKPAIVIAIDDEGVGRGSARTTAGVHLYEALAHSEEHLVRFGGHAQAAGLTIDEVRVDEFRASVSSYCAGAGVGGRPPVLVDAEVDLQQLDVRLVRELETLAPFGKANARPTLVCAGLTVVQSRRVGDGSHLKLSVRGEAGAEFGAIAFGMGERAPEPGARVHVAFSPAISHWAGRRRIELTVTEFWDAEQLPSTDNRAPSADNRQPITDNR
jgi:single-stranded-DNA-specific exonuclease